MSSRHLKTRKLPLMYHLNLWGIEQMRRRSPVGAVIAGLVGFDHVTLPKGPDQIIALVKPVQAQLGKAISKVQPFIRNYLTNLEYFDYEAISRDRRVRHCSTGTCGCPGYSALPGLRRSFALARILQFGAGSTSRYSM